MKKILITTDFSANSTNAVHYALDLFQETPCHFFLLYVNMQGLAYMEKPIYDFGTNILVEKESKTIEQKLRDLEKYFKTISATKNIHLFTTIHEEGYFLKSIRKHIEENNIELIVMGTKGANDVKEFFMGSNAGDVITKVECDVLVIPDKARYEGYEEVVFATDFALPYLDDILIGISTLISSKASKIRVLYVAKTAKRLSDIEQQRKENLLQRLTEWLPNPVSFHTLEDKNVEKTVLDFAQSISADLIIMVSKDYGFLHKQFLDTTVEEVSFDSHIPLLSLQG